MDQRDNQRNTHRMGRYGYAGNGRAPEPAPVAFTSAQSFDMDVLAASQRTPVLVDVTASWCGPCKALAPHLETLKQRYEERLVVLKLDGDQNPAVVQGYGVRAYPTLLLFRNGRVVKTHPGSPGTLSGLLAFVEPLA